MVAADALADLSIPEAGRRLRAGTLLATALTEAHLARIQERNGAIRALTTVTADQALRDAAAADIAFSRGIDRGMMQGIPYGLKDIIETASIRTTAGSRLRADHIPTTDALIAGRLATAGAVLLGKLATYEWAVVGPDATGLYPPALNPWDPDAITGGSSSGCAAAVAGGLMRTSFGSDTGGSIRSPAGYCGVVGLKPSFGRVPTAGVFPLSPSLDHVGPMSASVAEAALSLDAIADARPGTSMAASQIGQPVAGLRLRYARSFHLSDPDAAPDVVAALDDAASRLSLLGVVIEEVDLPDYRLFEDCGAIILHHEAFAHHDADLVAHGPAYGRQVFASLAAGCLLQAPDRALADRARRALTQAVDAALAGADAMLVANTLQTAPPVADFSRPTPRWTPMRTIAFNVTGHPALAVPIGPARNGLPMGMQLIGRVDEECVLCRIGAAWEAAGDWCTVKPSFPRAGRAADS